MYTYIFGILTVVLAFTIFLIRPDFSRFGILWKHCLVIMLPYLVTILFSAVVWIVELSPANVVSRGFFMPVYCLIGILAAGSALYLFGERGIYINLVSLLVANIVKLLQQVSAYGTKAVVDDYVNLVRSFGGTTGAIAKEFERYSYAYAFTIFMMYILLSGVKKKIRLGNVLLFLGCVLGFCVGFKRSALLGFAVGTFLGLLLMLVPEEKRKGVFKGGAVAAVILGQVIVMAIRGGLYHWLSDTFQINTMGRVEIYDAMKPYYEISPGFLGHGLGFVNRMLSSGSIRVRLGLYYQVQDIHNDFLRMYIEIGQIGFLTWIWSLIYTRLRYFADITNKKQAVLAFSCMAFWFVTFLSENIYYLYYAVLPLALVTMGSGLDEYIRERADDGR